MMRAIQTAFEYPPIPIRSFDWAAWRDGDEEGLTGRGPTEELAILDLLDREENQEIMTIKEFKDGWYVFLGESEVAGPYISWASAHEMYPSAW